MCISRIHLGTLRRAEKDDWRKQYMWWIRIMRGCYYTGKSRLMVILDGEMTKMPNLKVMGHIQDVMRSLLWLVKWYKLLMTASKETRQQASRVHWWNVLRQAQYKYFGTCSGGTYAVPWNCSGYGSAASVCEVRIHGKRVCSDGEDWWFGKHI